MSNFDGSLRAIMPYFSMKCIAISPYALPATTTLAPLQATHDLSIGKVFLPFMHNNETAIVNASLLLALPAWQLHFRKKPAIVPCYESSLNKLLVSLQLPSEAHAALTSLQCP